MSIKTAAALTTENTSTISSASTPDSITPTILGAILQDIIDSMINQTDLLINGVPLSTYITNLVTPLITGLTMNGVLGQFAVSLASSQSIFTNGIGTKLPVMLLNESTNGCFDNGNNFSGNTFVVPAGGFTGRFQLTDVIAEVEVVASGGADIYKIEINQYAGTTFGSTLAFSSITIPTTMAVGDKAYGVTVQTASVSLAAGVIVRIDIEKITFDHESIINLTNCLFNNIPL